MAQETRRPEPPLQALEVLGVHGPKVRDARPAGTWAKRTMRSANGALELEARPPAQGSDTFLQHQRKYGPNGSTPWSRSDRWPERLHEKRPLVNLSCVCTGESSGANVPYPKELCRCKSFELMHARTRHTLKHKKIPFLPYNCILTFTFTFTLDCHLGKTHDHRSRGDTTWRAQSTIVFLPKTGAYNPDLAKSGLYDAPGLRC